MTQEEKTDVSVQCQKLISRFYVDCNASSFSRINNDQFHEEWMSNAITKVLRCVYANYDKQKSKLSTFVYIICKQHAMLWTTMANYNLSEAEARKILWNRKRDKILCDENSNNQKRVTNVLAPDSINKPIMYSDDESMNERTKVESALVDETSEQELFMSEEAENTEILNQLIDYIANKLTKGKNQKMYFLYYIYANQKYTDIARHFGVSRQCIHSSLNKVFDRIKQDKHVKEIVDSLLND